MELSQKSKKIIYFRFYPGLHGNTFWVFEYFNIPGKELNVTDITEQQLL